MNRHGCLTLSLLVSFIGFSQNLFAANIIKPTAIYGEDHRLEVCEETNPAIRELAGGTLAMIPKKQMSQNGSGHFKYNKQSFGDKYRLCESERFIEQPIVADCSGFLVNEDTLVTAGHCVSVADCRKNYWVFNYKMQSTTALPKEFPTEDIYSCVEIIASEKTTKVDYAIIKLDRKVAGAKPLTMRSGSEPAIGEDLFVIGYPMGLPAKIAGGAKLRSWDDKRRFFKANLDTYGGNSGSPVINANTLEVEGILVRGEEDFVNVGPCKESKRCLDSGCDGEEITNIKFITDLVR